MKIIFLLSFFVRRNILKFGDLEREKLFVSSLVFKVQIISLVCLYIRKFGIRGIYIYRINIDINCQKYIYIVMQGKNGKN